MIIEPTTSDGYYLLHEGVKALAQVERNGMRINVPYVKKQIKRSAAVIRDLSTELKKDPVFIKWRKRFGAETNIGSRDQLGVVLYDVLKHPVVATTDKGRPSTDESALGKIDLPFVKAFLEIEKHKKIKNTYLAGVLRETSGEFLHPFFNLHTATTFRSSSDSPNFQNQPTRIPEFAKLIRQAFIPRNGYQIGELDFGGIEVGIAACYHKDPSMLAYIKDETKDMHRDVSMQIYKLPQDDITKAIRHCGKNKFVFPEFYGDFYPSVARALWEAIDANNLTTGKGVGLYEHLKTHGIRKLGRCDPSERPLKGTFERHIKDIEDHFWNTRFPVYTEWKNKHWKAYQKKGYFDTLTGFRIGGVIRRNQVINFPVQGSAFHCLLWCLIQIQKALRKYKMKTKIVGQIHDSIVADIHCKELNDFLQLAFEIMTVKLPQAWKWIIVPMKVEAELAPPGASWYEKKAIDYSLK